MSLCIFVLQKKEKENKVFLLFLERLGFFGDEERFRKGKMGLSVGRTCSQQQSIVWIKCSSVIQLLPSWFCAVVGSGGELGWNSLQNTMTLMRWWGELCLKRTSRNNTSKMNSQDNSASSSQSEVGVLGLAFYLHYKYDSWGLLGRVEVCLCQILGTAVWRVMRKWAPPVESRGLIK